MGILDRLRSFLLARTAATTGIRGEPAAATPVAAANDVLEADRLIKLGQDCEDQGLLAAALQYFDAAIVCAPVHARAYVNRGNVLFAMGDLQAAATAYSDAIRQQPEMAAAHFNRGNVLYALADFDAAVAAYNRALALDPSLVDAEVARANAYDQSGQIDKAIAGYESALLRQPGYVEVICNLGLLLARQKRFGDAAAQFRRGLAIAPEYPYLPGHLLSAQLYVCDWTSYHESVDALHAQVAAGRRAITPFHFVPIACDPAIQLQCARTYCADQYPRREEAALPARRPAGARLRIGYVSTDFQNHAVAALIAGLIEAHDRSRFELHAYSLGADDGGAMRRRLQQSFGDFHDVRAISDAEIFQHMRAVGIDIAVDLNGFTGEARPGLFTRRVAPLQIGFLGFPGTSGADYIDYFVADPVVVPSADAVHYSEQIIWLPDSYQPNDRARAIAPRTPPRSELGLPESGFVFCCFNNSFKIAPTVFQIWMRLLRRHADAVLWLLEDTAEAAANLRRQAAAWHVNPDRLIFAPRLDLPEHLARHRQADLFLDTLPYNAHTTASDALWAGLPLLTCVGNTFAGRVAASLLNAAGLAELITTDLRSYERLADELASNRDDLSQLKDRLAQHRMSVPLFDTDRFTRHLEASYQQAWNRYLLGSAPASFSITG